MDSFNEISEELIENGLSLSRLNQYINKTYGGIALSPYLLSVDEVKKIEKLITKNSLPSVLSIGKDWWLRTSSDRDGYVAVVKSWGYISVYGNPIIYEYGVRPAFHIENSEDLNLKLGDKVKVADEPCTIVLIEDGKVTALCDNVLFKSVFDEDFYKGLDYEVSDIKQNLENYFKDKELKVEIVKNQTLDEILNNTESKINTKSLKEISDVR